MTIKERVLFIQNVEEQTNVTAIKHLGIDVWPLIRDEFIVDERRVSNKNRGTVWRKLIIESFVSIFRLLRLMLAKRARNLYFSSSHIFEKDGNLYKHKLFQYLWDSETHNENIYFEYRKGDKKGSVAAIEFLTPTVLVTKILSLFIKSRIEDIQGFQEYLLFSKDRVSGAYIGVTNAKRLNKKIKTVKASQIYWRYMLRVLSIQKVYLIAYYNGHLYGFIKACRDLGIETIEVQHGLQGKYHLAYGSFNNVPPSGYNIIPEIFWCWNEIYTNEINSWAGKTTFHQAYNKGHLWIKYLQKNNKIGESSKKIVLFTAQPYEWNVAFRPFVIELLNTLGKKESIYLRLHPSQLSEQKDIEKYLNEKGINVELNIDEASKVDLPTLLNQTKLHITLDSSVVIEADLFNVDSIVLEDGAEEKYLPYIQMGRANKVSSIEELVKLIA